MLMHVTVFVGSLQFLHSVATVAAASAPFLDTSMDEIGFLISPLPSPLPTHKKDMVSYRKHVSGEAFDILSLLNLGFFFSSPYGNPGALTSLSSDFPSYHPCRQCHMRYHSLLASSEDRPRLARTSSELHLVPSKGH